MPSSLAPAACLRHALVGLLAAAGLCGSGLAADVTSTPGGKGAQVYCFMRSSGNSHDVSWVAAYALIKRQSASLFKTSPEHAAVMITEAVVQNPGTFPDCGKFLGDLHQKAAARDTQAGSSSAGSSDTTSKESSGPATRSERYAY